MRFNFLNLIHIIYIVLLFFTLYKFRICLKQIISQNICLNLKTFLNTLFLFFYMVFLTNIKLYIFFIYLKNFLWIVLYLTNNRIKRRYFIVFLLKFIFFSLHNSPCLWICLNRRKIRWYWIIYLRKYILI